MVQERNLNMRQCQESHLIEFYVMFPLESRKFPVSLPLFVLHEEELFRILTGCCFGMKQW